jgi:hypothetical protein
MASNGGRKISSPVGAMKSILKFLLDGLAAKGCGVENQQGPRGTQQQTQGKRLQASAHEDTLAAALCPRRTAPTVSGRVGGRWTVEWKGADRSSLTSDRDGRPFTGKE